MLYKIYRYIGNRYICDALSYREQQAYKFINKRKRDCEGSVIGFTIQHFASFRTEGDCEGSGIAFTIQHLQVLEHKIVLWL